MAEAVALQSKLRFVLADIRDLVTVLRDPKGELGELSRLLEAPTSSPRPPRQEKTDNTDTAS